jgi:Protein of unknown function (DUF642)/PEP-CTERM motif
MRKTLMLAVAAAAFSAIPTVASAQLVQNGGFELPVLPGAEPCCNTVPPDALPGWTVDAGNVNVVKGTYNFVPPGPNLAKEGNQYLDLVGQGGVGAISQNLATVDGETYTLTFWYANNIFGGAIAALAQWSIGSLSGNIAHATSTPVDLFWTPFSVNFIGTGSDVLSFASIIDAPNGSIFLDAISVTEAVPEASTWAMMIFGFGLAGVAIRRRKRKLAFA